MVLTRSRLCRLVGFLAPRGCCVVLPMLLIACSGGSAGHPPAPGGESVSESIFREALEHPPSLSEAKIVGERIDQVFNDFAATEVEYSTALGQLKWGDVYSVEALNQKRKLPALRKINAQVTDRSQKVFAKQAEILATGLDDLEVLSHKGYFARAMFTEYKNRYEEPETGLAAAHSRIRELTIEKLALVDRKLDILMRAGSRYKVLDNGHIAFQNSGSGIALAKEYEQTIIRHNQVTQLQRSLAESIAIQRNRIVSRYHELKGGTREAS